MNGRVYDPLIGRFLSADLHVTAPNNLQSYNRYSYVINNPLRYMDPTGFDWIDDWANGLESYFDTVTEFYWGTSGVHDASTDGLVGYYNSGSSFFEGAFTFASNPIDVGSDVMASSMLTYIDYAQDPGAFILAGEKAFGAYLNELQTNPEAVGALAFNLTTAVAIEEGATAGLGKLGRLNFTKYLDEFSIDTKILNGVDATNKGLYHSTSKAAVRPIMESGFRTDIPNPQAAFHNNRFGPGVYLSDSPAAALAEKPGGVVLNVEANLGRNLNLLDRGPVLNYQMGKAIGRGARKHGFDSITTISVQPNGGINTIVFDPAHVRPLGIMP